MENANVIITILTILGSLTLFLFGMKLVSDRAFFEVHKVMSNITPEVRSIHVSVFISIASPVIINVWGSAQGTEAKSSYAFNLPVEPQ